MKGLKSTLMAATAALLLGFTATAEATSIVGEIHISSTLNPLTNLGTTNTIDFQPNIGVVTFADNDFSSTLFTFATLHDINTITPLSIINPLWSVGGYTFTLLSTTVNTQNTNFLNILGTGFVSKAGFDDTNYNWSLTATRSNGSVSISATTVNNPVPEPMSLLLLGSGLAGLGAVRRKFSRS